MGPILGTNHGIHPKGPASLKEIEEFKEGLLEGGWPWSIAPDHQAVGGSNLLRLLIGKMSV